MATKTREELVEKIAETLGVKSPGNPLDDEDRATIDDNLDTSFAMLAAKGIVDVGAQSAIDMAYFDPLADWIANNIRNHFDGVNDPAAEAQAERNLRIVVANRPTFEPLRTEYF